MNDLPPFDAIRPRNRTGSCPPVPLLWRWPSDSEAGLALRKSDTARLSVVNRDTLVVLLDDVRSIGVVDLIAVEV
jgi:hypothetical protein